MAGEVSVYMSMFSEKPKAVTPRPQRNSSSSDTKKRANEVRRLIEMAMVTKATATTVQP
jgi:hypothetical protein